jgi:periplasmic protein TonB
MQASKILSVELIDIVFDGRNKDYGAYKLRKTYPNRLFTAVFITAVIVGLGFATAALGSNSKDKTKIISTDGGLFITPVDEMKRKEPKQQKPIEKREVVKTKAFTAPVITDKEISRPTPTVEDLDGAEISTKTTDGKEFEGIETGPEKPGEGTEIIPEKETIPDDLPFTVVEVPAKFSGNWIKFLLKNLNAEVPVDNNAPAGTYSVVIQFVVDKEGNVSEVKALTDHGYGLEEEALRVIRKADKWEPAIQNGYKVKAYHRQTITFQVEEE